MLLFSELIANNLQTYLQSNLSPASNLNTELSNDNYENIKIVSNRIPYIALMRDFYTCRGGFVRKQWPLSKQQKAG